MGCYAFLQKCYLLLLHEAAIQIDVLVIVEVFSFIG
jgi:hypothetical protein